tara:strand:- start:1071 stop:2015 length:945 start_codon:yes stop_codon:yes gene_type:complete
MGGLLKEVGEGLLTTIAPVGRKLSQEAKDFLSQLKKGKTNVKRKVTMLNNKFDEYKQIKDIIEKDGVTIGEAWSTLKPNLSATGKHNAINRDLTTNVLASQEYLPKNKETDELITFLINERNIYNKIGQTQKIPKTLETQLTTRKSGEGLRKAQKFQKYFDVPLEGEHIMMRPDKFELVELGKTDLAIKFRQAEYATTKERNALKNKIVSNIKRNIIIKNDLEGKLKASVQQDGKPDPDILFDFNYLSAQIDNASHKAADLGLDIAIVDTHTGDIKRYGGMYENILQLKKSVEKEGFQDGGLVSFEEVIGYNHG